MTTIRLRLLSQRKNVSSDYSVLKARPSKKHWTKYNKHVILVQSDRSVSMTVRFHLFPFRTQKLSSLVPKIVGWKRPVKIGRCRLLFKPCSDLSRAFFYAECRKRKRTIEKGGGPDMSGPYRDSSESLLLPQAGTAAGGRKRYACKSAQL